jgi:RND family efflux transporter MFP subunit
MAVRRIFALAIAVLVLIACSEKEKAKTAASAEVDVSQPTQQTVTDYLELTGDTQAIQSVDLRARVEGYLASVNFKDGDFVKEGDLLFVIEREPYQARLKLAQANVAAAEATLLRDDLQYRRQLSLVEQKATAQSDVEMWRAQRDSAQANLDQARANAELAAIDLSYTEIRAPFSGRIDRHLKDPGNLVDADEATLLATIYRLDPMYAYFTINEQELLRVRAARREQGENTPSPESPVSVFMALEGEEGYPHQGKVDFVATSLDSSTGTLSMRGVFSNPVSTWPPLLQPGMFVRVRIPVESHEHGLLVPERALGTDQSGRYLLVVDDQDVVEQRPVQVGSLEGTLRLITSGLKPEEWVVVQGIQKAKPGAKVIPIRRQGQVQAAQEAATK